ncbi:Crp/Fnr family transcriptional regulator [Candidatus Pelagadaptatus aseana]|uniref:Crp/Fnr family transcriptional regulator n=1 Tax=Candidatus Pelagadaptatus aseana TaxID=3120508 RepID=UPI003C6F9F25
MEQMRQAFDRQVGMPDDEWLQLEPLVNVREVPAKYTLQKIGSVATHHYFVVKGLVRFYYITPEGKELNKGFYGEDYIAGSLSAMIMEEPNRFAIETLEPSIVIDLPLKQIHAVSGPGTAWERLVNHCCQLMLVRNERREAELLTLTAKQRFLQFVRNFPGYLERIPQYHIASYLGITPVALSKYKKQWLADKEN